jgi:hypothetical protein
VSLCQAWHAARYMCAIGRAIHILRQLEDDPGKRNRPIGAPAAALHAEAVEHSFRLGPCRTQQHTQNEKPW